MVSWNIYVVLDEYLLNERVNKFHFTDEEKPILSSFCLSLAHACHITVRMTGREGGGEREASATQA